MLFGKSREVPRRKIQVINIIKLIDSWESLAVLCLPAEFPIPAEFLFCCYIKKIDQPLF